MNPFNTFPQCMQMITGHVVLSKLACVALAASAAIFGTRSYQGRPGLCKHDLKVRKYTPGKLFCYTQDLCTQPLPGSLRVSGHANVNVKCTCHIRQDLGMLLMIFFRSSRELT